MERLNQKIILMLSIISKRKELLSIEEENMLLKSALYEINKRLTENIPYTTPAGKIVLALNTLRYVQFLIPKEEQHAVYIEAIYGSKLN